MAQIIIGHFNDRDKAVAAAQEITTRQLVQREPRVITQEESREILRDLNKEQRQVELAALWTAAVFFVAATYIMVVNGRGVFAVAFPPLVALLSMAAAEVLCQLWQSRKRAKRKPHPVLMNDVVVDGARDVESVERVMTDSGADEVEILVA